MTFVRNLLADLVEKRLWPVAVLLAGVLVAMPILLGGGSGAGDADVVATPAQGAAANATDVRVSEETGVATLAPTGSKQNPFVQPELEKLEPAAEPAPVQDSAPAPMGGSTGETAPSRPSTPSMPDPAPAPAPQPEEKEQDTSVTQVTLRFGETGKARKAYRDIARLTALPNVSTPVMIYLGLKKDGETASFLIPSDAAATGEGACKPSAANCQTIELQAGDTTYVDLDLGDGARQYRLDVVSIAASDAKDAETASAARARVSRVGREFLRSSIESGEVSLEGMDFSEQTGTLTSTPRAKTAGPVGRGAYRIDIQVGTTTRTDVRRLQLLPQRSRARLLFLGVRDGGRSASFLNLDDHPVAGATCTPSPEECDRITLRRGRTAHVGGVPVRIAALSLRRLATDDAARAARLREDGAGRALAGDQQLDLGDLALDPATGTLMASPL